MRSLQEQPLRMPAEWEPHEATWLTWPHDEAHWPGLFQNIPSIWARMVRELEKGEDVRILIHDEATERSARAAMESGGVIGRRVHLHRVPSNFAWTRDHGPIFVKRPNGEIVASHWKYNAWGNKWAHDLDREIPKRVAEIANCERIEDPTVLEGGSIDVDGRGTLLTTESCLLHPNRNPQLSKQEIEERLGRYLGAKKILWLGDGIEGDDTDGHVDDLTRFVAPATVVTAVETRKDDPNFRPTQENLRRLQKMMDASGKMLTVHELHLPSPVIWENTRLPATYANFYIGNAVILLPIFQDPRDQAAVDLLQRLFPARAIAAIPARELVWGLGAFHCVTQQQPMTQVCQSPT